MQSMFEKTRIVLDGIVYVNHLTGNLPGSHTEFRTEGAQYYQLLYKLSGEAQITFDGKTVREQADDLRFTPNPMCFDHPPYYAADVIQQGESINIAFASASPLPREIMVYRSECAQTLKPLFQKMQKIWYLRHEGYEYRCMAIFYEILAVLSAAEACYLPPQVYEQIRPAIEYIDRHFTEENIDCTELAKMCGISQTYLTRLFQKRFSMPPNQYILSKKLQHACDLLRSSQYKVNEVAEKAGFVNTHYFSRMFKRHMGVSPSAYGKIQTFPLPAGQIHPDGE